MIDFISVILILIGINILINFFFKGAAVAAAGVKSAVTGKSFDETMGRMPPLTSRVVKKNTEDDGSGHEYYSVEVKGIFPIRETAEAAFAISLFDVTDGDDNKKPVLSVIEQFQETHTRAYLACQEIGRITGDQGFSNWVAVGKVIPLFVQSPYSGARKFSIVIRLISSDAVDELELGYANIENSDFFWDNVENLDLEQVPKGYSEEFEETKECFSLTVKLAMSVAMADGNLDEAEGVVIKQWMTKAIGTYSDNHKNQIKTLLNSTMKETFVKMQEGSLSKTTVIKRFHEIGDDAAKFEAMELCYDVMAADGVADEEEIKLLHRLGDALELDTSELERLRDLKMMSLSSEIGTDNSSLLGIDPDWSDDKIKKHLRAEFKKWNARLNNLQSGADKQHAQKMLDLIGEARNKYG